MPTFTITQPATGVELGKYDAENEQAALLMLAQDAGYDSVEKMDNVTGTSSIDELEFS